MSPRAVLIRGEVYSAAACTFHDDERAAHISGARLRFRSEKTYVEAQQVLLGQLGVNAAPEVSVPTPDEYDDDATQLQSPAGVLTWTRVFI